MKLKERLLREALRQFSTKGYAGTSTSSIIEATGASKGGLYNHFKNKEQLFLAAVSLARQIWRERNLHGIDRIPRPADRIIGLLINYRDRYLADLDELPGGCIFVNLAVELSDEHPQLADEVHGGFTRLKAMIHRLLEEERDIGGLEKQVDIAALTEQLFAGLLGACLVYGLDKSKASLDMTVAALCDLVERAKRPVDRNVG